MFDQLANNQRKALKKAPGKASKKGFTLPEIIVSFSVLVLVIVSATNVLTMVMRTNADNVDSMLAYGLAQEGLESFRFMRDSNSVLGLEFDGASKTGLSSVWGAKLLEKTGGGISNFVLLDKTPVSGCTVVNLSDCLPVGLKTLSGDVEVLSGSADTLVYLAKTKDPVDGRETFQYLQSADGSIPAGATPTQFHRLIVVQPLTASLSGPSDDKYNALRISSMVFWPGLNGQQKKVVLSSELTDWK